MKHEQIAFNTDGMPIRVTEEIRSLEQLSVVPLHMHDELEILLGVGGILEIKAGEECALLQEGEVAIVGRRVPHETRKCLPYTAYVLLQFRLEQTGSALSEGVRQYLSVITPRRERALLILPKADARTAEIYRLVMQIREENLNRSPACNYFIRGYLELLIGLLYREKLLSNPALRPDGVALQKLYPALEYIECHHDSEISLEQLCETVHLTPEYFCRLFKRSVGVSPIDYINRVRIFKAEKLLLSNHANVTEIALSLGFSSSSYFNRTFRRLTGMTPTEYRRIIYSQHKLM